MSQTKFHIPRQTDASLIQALTLIRQEMPDYDALVIRVTPHVGSSALDLPNESPLECPAIGAVMQAASEVMPRPCLQDSRNGHEALSIDRKWEECHDSVVVRWDAWGNNLPGDRRSILFVSLVALARKHLRASELDASLNSIEQSDFGKYKLAQLEVVNSLQELQKGLLIDFNRKTLEAEQAAKAKYQALEQELRDTFEKRQSEITDWAAEQEVELEKQKSELRAKEASFETKEARYVARKQQTEQMESLQKRLQNWSLTQPTQNKRWWVLGGCMVGVLFTGWLTWEFNAQNFAMLMSESLKGDITKVQWWQWALLVSRSILPAASCIAFVVYFIRWSASWAKQHADEEFNTHARVLDIGRAGWLLEAVRDAQDHKEQFPESLLKDLSRNLFVHHSSIEGTDHSPTLPHEALLQGLASLRFKTSDGTEVEMTKSKKTKE